MSISKLATSLLAALALLAHAAPAIADEGPLPAITISGEMALVSDYRFRGVSYSNGDLAVQGGVTATHESGLYLGTWASSIEQGEGYGSQELDLFAGWSGDIAPNLSVDAGLIYYAYPGGVASEANYFEAYASMARTFGPATAELGAVYAWEQASQGKGDNRYIYSDIDVEVPHTPVTVSGHLGYTDGVQAPALMADGMDETGLDWSLGVATGLVGPLSLSVSYIGVSGPSVKALTDDTVVATLTASF